MLSLADQAVGRVLQFGHGGVHCARCLHGVVGGDDTLADDELAGESGERKLQQLTRVLLRKLGVGPVMGAARCVAR